MSSPNPLSAAELLGERTVHNGASGFGTLLQGRAYQVEMLEESMRRNIIVAVLFPRSLVLSAADLLQMDTGSGKTLVAIMRIQAELERCPPGKLVWFCVPTVALAAQQHEALATQLPGFQARLLSGADNVEYWTEQWIWDDVLEGIDVVISTHQVLLDALIHGFLGMDRLALLVFDEAHSCIGNHPSSRIMRDFYHTSPAEARPSILGLSASPLVKNKAGNLRLLESNLDAISRTPRVHRDELLRSVHQPEIIKLFYSRKGAEALAPQAVESLRKVYEGLDIEQDPWVIKMKSDPTTRNARALHKALISNRTYCHDQIKGLYDRALAVLHELGSYAAEYYVRQCVAKFRQGAAEGSIVIESLEDPEKVYIQKKLADGVAFEGEGCSMDSYHTPPKVLALIQCLRSMESVTFSGLIFVRTRAEVFCLSHILSIQIPGFRVAAFVGFSGRRHTLGDLADLKNQKGTLDDLRLGRKNLIVTTNALEEGIDVSACNVVICFDKPPNLKSFIQRRGRARRSESRYFIMFEDDGQDNIISMWHELEEDMKRTYMDELRLLEDIQRLESVEEQTDRELVVQSSGAKLTIKDAVQHLYHFCATLPKVPYAESNPIFFFEEHSSVGDKRSISAKVLLPNSVDVAVRSACSQCSWISEKMARKDAAFEAYRALRQAGLVDEHLLPLGHTTDETVKEAYGAVKKRPGMVKVSEQIDVWSYIAQCWQDSCQMYGYFIKLTNPGRSRTEMSMLLPIKIPAIAGTIDLYWDQDTTFEMTIEPEIVNFSPAVIASAAQITYLLLESVFRSRIENGRYDFMALFIPSNCTDYPAWLSSYSGVIKAEALPAEDFTKDVGLVRDLSHSGRLHIFQNIRSSANTLSEGVHDCNTQFYPGDLDQRKVIEVKRLPKRADFLHPIPSNNVTAKGPGTHWLPTDECELGRLPYEFSIFALFVPAILHKVQVAVIAQRLCDTILSPLKFQNRTLVTAAISASSAHEDTDYQRLETLGDSVLKLMASTQLMAEYPNYHEGILSHKKDHIVNNNSLATAARRVGLDRFIITKPFTGQKWRPLYQGGLVGSQPELNREMSTKVLADVVEALIGASYVEGGPQNASACLEIFLPEIKWSTALRASQILYGLYIDLQVPPYNGVEAEKIISHEFHLKSLLLESLTHPSHHGASSSYQRLEFGGDAILDTIVTTTAFGHEPPLPAHRLHLIRAALVNANFLGFLCLTRSVSIRRFEVFGGNEATKIATIDVPRRSYLWQSMRHTSPSIRAAQQNCLSRYEVLHTNISDCLAHGYHYPWTTLARLEPPKFFSDIVESILGAIYIDTHGSLSHCVSFLEHLGLMPYLRRVLDNDIAVLHPKEELGQLADQDNVTYVLGKELEEGEERLTCTVIVGEMVILSVGNGLSTMEVQTRAADEACKMLRQHKSMSGNRELAKARRMDQGEDDTSLGEDKNEDEKGQLSEGEKYERIYDA